MIMTSVFRRHLNVIKTSVRTGAFSRLQLQSSCSRMAVKSDGPGLIADRHLIPASIAAYRLAERVADHAGVDASQFMRRPVINI
jgi:hypothetical protein